MTTTTQLTLTDFLLARIAEDEKAARARAFAEDCIPKSGPPNPRPLAEVEAKRRIVEWHQSWPILVEQQPTFDQDAADMNSMTFRMSKQIAWLTTREYIARFGTEPPTTPIMAALAAVYADHPDYRDEWRP